MLEVTRLRNETYSGAQEIVDDSGHTNLTSKLFAISFSNSVLLFASSFNCITD